MRNGDTSYEKLRQGICLYSFNVKAFETDRNKKEHQIGTPSGTRTHSTGFGNLHSIQLSYGRLNRDGTSYQKITSGKAFIKQPIELMLTL